MCDGVQVKKTKSRQSDAISVRLSSDFKAKLQAMADTDRRNLSQYVQIILENHVSKGVAILQLSVSPVIQTATPPPGMRAAAPVKAPPPTVLQQVMSDDPEGWEGGVKAK